MKSRDHIGRYGLNKRPFERNSSIRKSKTWIEVQPKRSTRPQSSKIGSNPSKGYSNLEQNFTQRGLSKEKKQDTSSASNAYVIKVLGTIPPGGNPKDGVVNRNKLNQETQQQEKGHKNPSKLSPINEKVVHTLNPSFMFESLPCDSLMEMDPYGGEGKEAPVKDKMVAKGSKASDNASKMEANGS